MHYSCKFFTELVPRSSVKLLGEKTKQNNILFTTIAIGLIRLCRTLTKLVMKTVLKDHKHTRILSKFIPWRKGVGKQKRRAVLMVVIYKSVTPNSLERSWLCGPSLMSMSGLEHKQLKSCSAGFLQPGSGSVDFSLQWKKIHTHSHQITEVQEREKVVCLLRSYQAWTAALRPGVKVGVGRIWEFKAKMSSLFCYGLIPWPHHSDCYKERGEGPFRYMLWHVFLLNIPSLQKVAQYVFLNLRWRFDILTTSCATLKNPLYLLFRAANSFEQIRQK